MSLLYLKELQGEVKPMKSLNPLTKIKQLLQRLRRNKLSTFIHLYNEHVDTQGLISDGVAEHTLCVELDGMPIKVRADYIKEGMIIDVKTSSDPVDKFSAAKTIIRFDYDLSAALYVDAFKKYTGQDHEFIFAFLNKQNGDVGILKASEALLKMVEKNIKQFKKDLLKLKNQEYTLKKEFRR